MRKVLRGYAEGQDGNLIHIVGTIPIPHSKDKRSQRERQDKRHLIRQGATIFKRKLFASRPMPRPYYRSESRSFDRTATPSFCREGPWIRGEDGVLDEAGGDPRLLLRFDGQGTLGGTLGSDPVHQRSTTP